MTMDTGETFELEVAGLQFTCTVGRFPNGRFGEPFLNNIGSLMTDMPLGGDEKTATQNDATNSPTDAH